MAYKPMMGQRVGELTRSVARIGIFEENGEIYVSDWQAHISKSRRDVAIFMSTNDNQYEIIFAHGNPFSEPPPYIVRAHGTLVLGPVDLNVLEKSYKYAIASSTGAYLDPEMVVDA